MGEETDEEEDEDSSMGSAAEEDDEDDDEGCDSAGGCGCVGLALRTPGGALSRGAMMGTLSVFAHAISHA